jgi:ribonuclease P protein component
VEFSLKLKPHYLGRPRVQTVVGKNVLRKATERNLLKRRLRGILGPEAKARRSDIVVIVRGKGNDLTFTQIKEKVIKVLKQYGRDF